MSLSYTVSEIIARYWSKIADFNPSHLYLALLFGVTPSEFYRGLWRQKTRFSELSYLVVCVIHKFSDFGTITTCVHRTLSAFEVFYKNALGLHKPNLTIITSPTEGDGRLYFRRLCCILLGQRCLYIKAHSV